jgi:hypothetical protein
VWTALLRSIEAVGFRRTQPCPFAVDRDRCLFFVPMMAGDAGDSGTHHRTTLNRKFLSLLAAKTSRNVRQGRRIQENAAVPFAVDRDRPPLFVRMMAGDSGDNGEESVLLRTAVILIKLSPSIGSENANGDQEGPTALAISGRAVGRLSHHLVSCGRRNHALLQDGIDMVEVGVLAVPG